MAAADGHRAAAIRALQRDVLLLATKAAQINATKFTKVAQATKSLKLFVA